jgi:alkylation response protein AidB-like acyl-CoA dehydrogenase
MHFELNEEQKLIRKMVRDLAENKVKPIAQAAGKEHRFPMGNFCEMGFFGLSFPDARWHLLNCLHCAKIVVCTRSHSPNRLPNRSTSCRATLPC